MDRIRQVVATRTDSSSSTTEITGAFDTSLYPFSNLLSATVASTCCAASES
jgi:hypothetical protein